jgi:glyoxylase-like metal-dependent hydrolase (beta-lactamase superfamily II)
MITTTSPAPGIDVITARADIAGLGTLPINAFLLHGAEPVLVDAGPVNNHDEFLTALGSLIDPGDIRWLWLTHPDPDHIGALRTLLATVPELTVVTTFLAVGYLGLSDPLPMDRIHLCNPGQQLRLTDRTLTATSPPTFDNPATTGLYDDSTGSLCSADSFGALLADPTELPERADDLAADDLRAGQVLWSTIDAPWLHGADPAWLADRLDQVRRMAPARILSGHLPPADGAMTERLLANLQAVRTAEPFVGPDQSALEVMLAGLAPAPA